MESKIDWAIRHGKSIYSTQDELVKEFNGLVNGFIFDLSNPEDLRLREIISISKALENCNSEVKDFEETLANWDRSESDQVWRALESA